MSGARYVWRPKSTAPATALALDADPDTGWRRTCRVCGRVLGPEKFGFRNVDGKWTDQPRCTRCRHRKETTNGAT